MLQEWIDNLFLMAIIGFIVLGGVIGVFVWPFVTL